MPKLTIDQIRMLETDGGDWRMGDVSDAELVITIIILTVGVIVLLGVMVMIILIRRQGRVRLLDGPIDIEVEEEEGTRMENDYLVALSPNVRAGYARAKRWQEEYPPEGRGHMTVSQLLAIEEKGVAAWEFEVDYESNPGVIVQGRTEICFLADGWGMAPAEGGGCAVQSNLPLPLSNEVCYWECKIFAKPEGSRLAIGVSTKPYPSFRLPGWNAHSVGYHDTGATSVSFPFNSRAYGPALCEGDILGVGYRPRTGSLFFTRNGKRMADVYTNLGRLGALYPTVGATGSCEIHVNFGQSGFVFIEANVKKWALAPMTGTLAPPPAYGLERGSILLARSGERTHSLRTTDALPLSPSAGPPPAYNPVDPNMYAPGVAEALLEDAFGPQALERLTTDDALPARPWWSRMLQV